MVTRQKLFWESSNKKNHLHLIGFLILSAVALPSVRAIDLRLEYEEILKADSLDLYAAQRLCVIYIQEEAFDRVKDPLAILIDGSAFEEIAAVLEKILTIENKPEGLLENEIRSIFQVAKESDNVNASDGWLKITYAFYDHKLYVLARKLYENREHNECKYRLGIIYNSGYGVPVNYGKALEYFSQIPEYRNTSQWIGLIYYYGEAVERDYKKSLYFLNRYYAKAPKDKRQSTAYYLGKHYYRGLGCEKDYEKALNYFREASESTKWWGYFSDYYIGRINWATKKRGDSYKKKAFKAFEQ